MEASSSRGRPRFVDKVFAFDPSRDEVRLHANTLDLPFQAPLKLVASRDRKQLERDARAAGVYDENGFGHGVRPGGAAWLFDCAGEAWRRRRRPCAFVHCLPAM